MELTAIPIHAGNFLSRVLDPLAHALNREATKSILNSHIDPEIQTRAAVLVERANEGELTPDMLAIFTHKVRQHLMGNG
jgi:hypothetical protein